MGSRRHAQRPEKEGNHEVQGNRARAFNRRRPAPGCGRRVAAVITNSQAILLDGLFNACYFVTALFTLRVALLLKRPDDVQFPFGYLYFELLINAVKGLLILGVALFALIDAALTILAGGREVAAGGAIGYAAFATALCLAMALLLRRARRHVGEPAGQRGCGEMECERSDLRRSLRRVLRHVRDDHGGSARGGRAMSIQSW
jgi:Co/Zn/Cd efflux system component